MKALIINNSKDKVPVKWLGSWVSGVSRELVRRRLGAVRGKELILVFVSRSSMRKLNHQFRGQDSATDVLSFESADPTSVGELVLCLTVIHSQSRHTGLSERGELGYMIVHGALHLLGFDHMSAGEEAEMFAIQDDIYACLEKRVGLK